LTLVALRPIELVREDAGTPLVPSPGSPFDNLGVPGALVSEALVAESSATSSTGNPFYDLVLGGRGTFAEQAAELDPTLVLLWIGTSDVLRFVAAGGDTDLAPGLPTPVGTFANTYEALLDAVLAITDQVVLFTIPDPRSMPISRAVPGIVLDPDTGLPVIITVIEPVIDPIPGEPVVDPVTGDTLLAQRQSTVPLLGPAGPLAPGDLVLLDALPLLEDGIGIPAPVGGTGELLPDRAVLDAAEQVDIGATVAVTTRRSPPSPPTATCRWSTSTRWSRLSPMGADLGQVLLDADYAVGQAFQPGRGQLHAQGVRVVANLVIDALDLRYGPRSPPPDREPPGNSLLGLP
jgi:hypothetical protein